MFAKNKLNSIEILVSQALIDMELSHEEIITILKEKDKYEKMKESARSVTEKTRKYEIEQCEVNKNNKFVTDA